MMMMMLMIALQKYPNIASRRRVVTWQELELYRPVPNKAIGAAAFRFVGPDRWNKLPERLRESASLNIFKRDLKTRLFNNSF